MMTTPEQREAIARIIAPFLWNNARERYLAREDEVRRGERIDPITVDMPSWAERAAGVVADSLAKADAILALPTPSREVSDIVERLRASDLGEIIAKGLRRMDETSDSLTYITQGVVDEIYTLLDALSIGGKGEDDPDLGKIGPGHVCKHGVRWPHACLPCDEAAYAAHIVATLDPRLQIAREALLKVVWATRAYLSPDGITAEECISRVLAATDNPEITPLILEFENGRS